MDTLVSSWYRNAESLPEKYVFPPGERPGKLVFSPRRNNPIIDLNKAVGHARAEIIQQVMEASKEFGFFQVINHGVSESLMKNTTNVLEEFFSMSAEEKAPYFSMDQNKACRLYTSSYNYVNEESHFWRDNLTHFSHPVEDYVQFWPDKPSRYREVVGTYSIEARNLVLRILNIICEGLGLEAGYFEGEVSKVQLLSVNHYPPCPDPSLTLGMSCHCDPSLITIMHQGNMYGLQFIKDGKWLDVEPKPEAFVVVIGCQLQVISNEKITSVGHRVVNNSKGTRTVVGTFMVPSQECVLEPARELVSASNPPRYRAFQYKDFKGTYAAKNGDYEATFEFFKIKA